MRISLIAVFFAFLVSGCATHLKPYAFHSEPFSAKSHVKIIGNPGFAQGLIVILKLDGEETRTSPMISSEIRKSNENLFVPSGITVPAGKHKLGVVYIYTDTPGKLFTAKMVTDYEEMYLPKGKRDYVTVKHYEEFDLETKISMNYELYRIYDEKSKSIRITVSECDENKECSAISTQASGMKDTASEGWANPKEL